MTDTIPGRPTMLAGIQGSGAALRAKLVQSSSSGAPPAMTCWARPSTRCAPAISWYIRSTVSWLSSCSANSNSVTTPKLPPPPRMAQNRSGCWSAAARRIRPSAVTTSAARRLSMVSPNRRISRPTPPPRVSPATPVCEITPAGTTSPCRWVAWSRSRSSAPPPTVARRVTGSTDTWFIGRRSMTSPPSQVLNPGRLCPPPRTAITRPSARA